MQMLRANRTERETNDSEEQHLQVFDAHAGCQCLKDLPVQACVCAWGPRPAGALVDRVLRSSLTPLRPCDVRRVILAAARERAAQR